MKPGSELLPVLLLLDSTGKMVRALSGTFDPKALEADLSGLIERAQ